MSISQDNDMSTYVYVKRNTKHPYTYSDVDAPYMQFKRVRMSVAYNMFNSKVGWDRAKKGDYEHWRQLMQQTKKP